jgi:hypothetical protein
MAEECKALKARHYRWFEEASYEAEVPYLDQMMRAKADEAWAEVEGFVRRVVKGLYLIIFIVGPSRASRGSNEGRWCQVSQ